MSIAAQKNDSAMFLHKPLFAQKQRISSTTFYIFSKNILTKDGAYCIINRYGAKSLVSI